ncbi:DUF2238 domain-containing protein, partial [Candidatus Pacebacteria bacterium]|nr:DUF2238 domain-containing protein [Candidatus Paceibacterota bacterium]
AVMTYRVFRNVFNIQGSTLTVIMLAVLTSVGISALNEIMEFFIALSVVDNGVGGYNNTMLDFVFNLLGAIIATAIYSIHERSRRLKNI